MTPKDDTEDEAKEADEDLHVHLPVWNVEYASAAFSDDILYLERTDDMFLYQRIEEEFAFRRGAPEKAYVYCQHQDVLVNMPGSTAWTSIVWPLVEMSIYNMTELLVDGGTRRIAERLPEQRLKRFREMKTL
jgi:hypothetical protein